MAPEPRDLDQNGPDLRDSIRVLARDERDLDGRLVKAGSAVLCHPSQPQAFRQDTPVNRQEFLRQDRTWTLEARQRLWWPPLADLPADLAGQVEACRAARTAFLAAIDENLASAVGRPIPEVQSLPFWFSLLAWEPTIREAVEVADLSDSLAARMAQTGGVPPEVAWPDEWRQQLLDLNVVRVYALSGLAVTIHVVAAFVTPVQLHCGSLPQFLPPTAGAVDSVQDVVRQWARSRRGNGAVFTFFTIGSASPWPQQVTGQAAGDHWVVISALAAQGKWQTRTPPRFADRLSLRDFLDRLRPVTAQQRISQIKLFVDGLLNCGYEGNIHLEKIAKETGYRRSAVWEALLAMQESGHYQLYETANGGVAVGPQTSVPGVPLTPASHSGRRWLCWLACLGPAIGVTVWFLNDAIMGEPFQFRSFMLSVPLAYAGEWLDTRLGKWREDKE